ncbi:hypothetical protein Tco_1351155 [Tanacetum coccineum]
MHPFNPSCEIANSSICIFPRVKFSPHDPIVHHSGHDIKRRVKVNVSSSLVGKVSKYSTTGSSVVVPSPSLGPLFWGSSSSRMIWMNITSSSSSIEQTNFVLEDWGTNPSDSSIEFSFRTYLVAMEANGSGCGYGLELVFLGRLLKERFGIEPLDWNRLGVTKIVFLGLESIPLTSRFIGTRGCVFNKGLFGAVSEQDEPPSSVGLDFQARLDDGRMYSGHLEAM